MNSKRIFYFDNLKCLLILFVVLNHTISVCADHYIYEYSWFKIITFFLIPLFIFTTGLFARKSSRSPLERFTKILCIYIIAQVAVTLYYEYFLNIVKDGETILIPRFTLWYLLTCSYLYLSEYLFRKYSFKKVFITTLIIGILSGFFQFIDDYLSISRTITFLPFFVLGYYSKDIDLLKYIKKYKNIILILVIILTIWFIFNQNFFEFKDTYFKYSYFDYNNPFECFYKRCLMYIIFMIFSAFILNITPKKEMLISHLGKYTLIIYLVHGVLLKTMYKYKLFIGNPILGTIFTYIIVMIISIIISFITSKVKSYVKIKEEEKYERSIRIFESE